MNDMLHSRPATKISFFVSRLENAAVLHYRCDQLTVLVVQHHLGAEQVRSALAAARVGTMAERALHAINALSGFDGGRIGGRAFGKCAGARTARSARTGWTAILTGGRRIRRALRRDTGLVSVMLANNETGVLFPIEEIGRIVRENSNAVFHVDGVQAVGKIPINLSEWPVDLFSVSGHKFHAPKGVGALYIRHGVKLPPFIIGGGQEQGL